MQGGGACPFVNREDPSGLDAGDWTLDAESQFDGGNGAIRSRGLRSGAKHGAGENHSGAPLKLFPLRAENTLGDSIIGLRGGERRQDADGKRSE